jgi:hypothetical protein
MRKAIEGGAVSVDLLYRDHEGGQRTISHFSMVRREEGAEGHETKWWSSLGNHRSLDDS